MNSYNLKSQVLHIGSNFKKDNFSFAIDTNDFPITSQLH